MAPVQSAAEEEVVFLQLMEFNNEWETLQSILYDAPECPRPHPHPHPHPRPQPIQLAEEETTVSTPASASMDANPPQPTEEGDTVKLELPPAPVKILSLR